MNLEKATDDYHVALAVLEAARTAARKADVGPGPWILALVDELAIIAQKQRIKGCTQWEVVAKISELLDKRMSELDSDDGEKH